MTWGAFHQHVKDLNSFIQYSITILFIDLLHQKKDTPKCCKNLNDQKLVIFLLFMFILPQCPTFRFFPLGLCVRFRDFR